MSFEEALGSKSSTKLNVWQWLGEHAADTFHRFKMGVDAIAPCKEVTGREVKASTDDARETGSCRITERLIVQGARRSIWGLWGTATSAPLARRYGC